MCCLCVCLYVGVHVHMYGWLGGCTESRQYVRHARRPYVRQAQVDLGFAGYLQNLQEGTTGLLVCAQVSTEFAATLPLCCAFSHIASLLWACLRHDCCCPHSNCCCPHSNCCCSVLRLAQVSVFFSFCRFLEGNSGERGGPLCLRRLGQQQLGQIPTALCSCPSPGQHAQAVLHACILASVYCCITASSCNVHVICTLY